ncbi:hypothetical protein TWF696_001146 [Orbilia brochopaga]|uniref:Uncharacterized protein n=1 Tax=Orbilia brochopaga TaxID=3140254 RepID=A0AAV9VFX6_9PEZI
MSQSSSVEREEIRYRSSVSRDSSSVYSSNSSSAFSSDNGSTASHRSDDLEKLLDGEGANNVLNNHDPESLLPMLARILSHSPNPAIQESDVEDYLRRLFRFAAAFRNSASPFDLMDELTRDEARNFQFIMNQFLLSLTRYKQPLAILQYIFHQELNVNKSSVETKQLILTVLADLPYLFEGWVNLWIGLVETEWCSIWSLTCYIREVEKRVVAGASWLSRQGKWVSVCIAKKSGLRARVLLQTSADKRHHALPQAVQVGVRGPGPEDWERQEYRTKTLMKLTGKGTPEFTSSELHTGGSQARLVRPLGGDRRLERPRGICLELKSPEEEKSTIDVIVSKYARQPRLRSTEEEDQLQELARRQRSEEEFNKELKRRDKERRLKEELEKLSASGAFGNESRRNLTRTEGNSSTSPLDALLSTVVKQDREIDDTHFETWAMELLEDTAGEPHDRVHVD